MNKMITAENDIKDILELLKKQEILYTNNKFGDWKSILPLSRGGCNLAPITGVELLYESNDCEAWKLVYPLIDPIANNVLVVVKK